MKISDWWIKPEILGLDDKPYQAYHKWKNLYNFIDEINWPL